MSGYERYWILFGGVWLVVGASFVVVSLAIFFLADPAALNQGGPPLWVFTLIGLAAAGAGSAVITRARQTAAHDKRLMESGHAQHATVTEIRLSPIRINREPRWNIFYRYEFRGRALEGRSCMLSDFEVEKFKPGQPARIVLDPKRPEDSLFLVPN